MKNLILTFALIFLVGFGANAQNEKGDWYVGTSEISNSAWTEWEIAPTLGYGVTNRLMVGLGISQADSTEDIGLDFHARYFINAGKQSFFLYASIDEFNTDNIELGLGKMFTFHRDAIFIDPRIVYHTGNKTVNLTLGLGLKF